MQEYLDDHPEAELHVYTVWLPALSGDARDRWNPLALDDPRVRHYWDQGQLLGRWYKTHEDFQGTFGSFLWDAWVLYDEGATWDPLAEEPGERLGWGWTIIQTASQLGQALDGLGALPSPTATATATATPTEIPSPTAEPTDPLPTPTEQPSETPVPTETPTAEPSQTPTGTPTDPPTAEPSATPLPTLAPTLAPSPTPPPTEPLPSATPTVELRPVLLPMLVTRRR